MRIYEKEVTYTLLLVMLIGFAIIFSGCIESSTTTTPTPTITPTITKTSPTPIPTPKPIVYGFIITIALDKMTKEFIDTIDNNDKYEVETNVGTIDYRGYSYQTNKVTLWKGDTKKIINNVIEYDLETITSSRGKLNIIGFISTIKSDKMNTELIKFSDNYDKYETEDNVGTINYRGYSHQTNKVTLWRGDNKEITNNVIAYSLAKRFI